MTSKMAENAWASLGYFLHHLDSGIRKMARIFKRFHLKIKKKKRSAVFNQTRQDIYIYIYIYIYMCVFVCVCVCVCVWFFLKWDCL